MIYRLSHRLATLCVSCNIIDSCHFPHLQYKAEILLRSSLFSLFLILLAFSLHKPLEVFIFALTTHLFRRHMGGWHAPTPWMCQILSLGVVSLMTLLVGPLVTMIPQNTLFFLCLVLDFFILFLAPAYPPQLHLTLDEEKANIIRKNIILAFVIVIQICSFLSWDFRIVIYTFLGLATTVMTVLLEKICLKKGCRVHEQAEENYEANSNSVC